MKFGKYLCQCSLLGALNFTLVGVEAAENNLDEKRTMEEETRRDMVDKNRDSISRYVVGIARNIDAYLAGDNLSTTDNKSHLTLKSKWTFRKAGDFDDRYRVRGKLDLPNTKKRLKLFIDSDAERENSLEESILNSREDIGENRESSRLGLEFFNKKMRRWNRFFRVGVRFRGALDPFFKAQIKREDNVFEHWLLTTKQELWYYDREGWGERTSFLMEKPKGDNALFRVLSSAQFEDDSDEFELAQAYSFLQALSDKRSIEYSTGVLGTNRPSLKTTDYFLSVRYRQRLYKDWIYLSVIPELIFPREDSFKPNPAFGLNLEVVFSE